jgi:hypothetical protein
MLTCALAIAAAMSKRAMTLKNPVIEVLLY